MERTTDLSGASGEEEGAAVEPPLVGLATLSVLATAAEAVPVLYIVDDAHWLDAATADALLLCAYRLVRTGWSWLELTAELTSDQLSGVELLPWLAASGRRDAGRARRR